MKVGTPWTVKGIRPYARATAQEAARRSGVSLGDWLNSAIFEQAEEFVDDPADDQYEDNSQIRELASLRERLDQLIDRLETTVLKEPAVAPTRNRSDAVGVNEILNLLERRLRGMSIRTEPQNVVAPPTAPSSTPEHDFSGLKKQLDQIIDRLETLRHPSLDAFNTLRAELEGINRAVNEGLPRHALETIEWQLKKLNERLTDSQQTESGNAVLARIESGLADLRSALRNPTPTSLKQIEGDIAVLREMIAQVASDESVRSLTARVSDLSGKIAQIQEICANYTALYTDYNAARTGAFAPSQLRTEHIVAPEVANESAFSPPTGSARFIAAARRAARVPLRESNSGAPTLKMSGHAYEGMVTPQRWRKLMSGIKILLMAASFLAIMTGSIEIIDHGVSANFLAQLITNTAASDKVLKNNISEVEAEGDVENSSLSHDVTPQRAIQEQSREPTAVLLPISLPASGNLFDAIASSNVSKPIQGAPSLFDPPMNSELPPQNNAGDKMSAASVNGPPTVNSAGAAEDLPPAIGGERLRKAALAGDPAAAYIVAQRYAEGHGVPASLEEAARWYGQAARKGLVPAQFRYAAMLEKGEGVKKNPEQARQIYLAATAKGDAKSMHNLAGLYTHGIDGKPDYAKAVFWFRKAANYGIRDSQYNLAVLTERGLGTDANPIEAYKWYALAAAQNDHEAKSKRDEISAQLDAEQFATAQASVRAFTAKPQPKEALLIPTPADSWDSPAEVVHSRSEQSTPSPTQLSAFKIGAK